MFGRPLFQVLDKNKDSSVTWAEFTEGFSALFKEWNSDKSGYVTLAQLRSGIQKDLPPQSQGFPGGGRSLKLAGGYPG